MLISLFVWYYEIVIPIPCLVCLQKVDMYPSPATARNGARYYHEGGSEATPAMSVLVGRSMGLTSQSVDNNNTVDARQIQGRAPASWPGNTTQSDAWGRSRHHTGSSGYSEGSEGRALPSYSGVPPMTFSSSPPPPPSCPICGQDRIMASVVLGQQAYIERMQKEIESLRRVGETLAYGRADLGSTTSSTGRSDQTDSASRGESDWEDEMTADDFRIVMPEEEEPKPRQVGGIGHRGRGRGMFAYAQSRLMPSARGPSCEQ